MNKWLHRNGVTYKTVRRPHKFSEEKQRQFIEYYKELKTTVGDEPILLLMESIRLRPLKSAMAGYAKARKSSKNNRQPHAPEYHGGAESESTDVTANLRI